MGKDRTNSGKSVKDRLLNLARAEHYSPQLIISHYMQERLLYRLSISRFHDKFTLKGGMLLYAYDRLLARPTMDIDFMAMYINNDKDNVRRVIQEICNIECPTDGASYDADTVETAEIIANMEYHGVRASVVAHLDTACQRISIDIGFDDVVTPVPETLSFPALIETVPPVEILAYSMETVVAEKFHAMISLSNANSRMKDFYDVYTILVSDRVNVNVLAEAIKSTFANRGTSYCENHPVFTDEFYEVPDRQALWNGFLRKIRFQGSLDFPTVGAVIRESLLPCWELLR